MKKSAGKFLGAITYLGFLFSWRPGSLVKGTFAMTVGMGLRTLGQAAIFFILARVLGVEDYGAYSAVLALAMTLGGFGGLGVSMVMLRDTARCSAVFVESWGRVLAALVVTTPLLFVIYLALAWLLLPDQISWVAIICLGLAEILFSPFALASVQAYQGHERIGRAARMVLTPVVPRLIAALVLPAVLLLPVTNYLSIWAFAYLVAAFISTLYAFWLLRRDFALGGALHWRGLIRSLREGWAFSVSGAARKVYADTDKVMLARLVNLEVAGAYSAAYRVVDMACIPLMSFFSAVMPRFFRTGHESPLSAMCYALRLLPLPAIYALGTGGVLYVLAGILPWLLGAEFELAVEVVRWLFWLPLVILGRSFLQYVVVSMDRQHTVMTVLLVGAAINIILNLCLIPHFSWRGAVLATYTAEILMILMFAGAVKAVVQAHRKIVSSSLSE